MENNILEQLGLEESEAKIYTALFWNWDTPL